MSDIVVHKFGGSCLREGSDIDRIAEIIQKTPGKPLIVVSALWGMTDRLYRAAREPHYAGRLVQDVTAQHLLFAPGLDSGDFSQLFNQVISGISKELVKLSGGEPSLRSENLILAAGERLSALAVAHRLRSMGMNAHPVGAEDIGLKLKGTGRASQIDIEASSRSLKRGNLIGIPILTGWFGEGSDGDIAILSRGGSDHSAAAFANLMNAKKLILWKDIDGIKQLNPRWGIDTPAIPYLGYGQAAELSIHGTPVIHPATVAPLIEQGIPLEVRNINTPFVKAPTVIGPDINPSSTIAIGCHPGVAVITQKNSINSELLARLEQADVHPWLMNSTPEEMRMIIPTHEIKHISDLIDGSIEYKTAIISIIGSFDYASIDYEVVSTNEYGTRYIIETKDLHQALRNLYQSLFSLQDCK